MNPRRAIGTGAPLLVHFFPNFMQFLDEMAKSNNPLGLTPHLGNAGSATGDVNVTWLSSSQGMHTQFGPLWMTLVFWWI